MTPEGQLIHRTGIALLGEIVWLTTATLLYGVFVLLFSFTMAKMTHRRLSLASRAMAVITIISFLIVSLHWAAEVSVVVIFVRSVLVVDVDTPLGERRTLADIVGHDPNLITKWTSGVLPLLSDATIIWRAWALFPERRWVVFAPAFLLLSSTATIIAHIGVYAASTPTTNPVHATNLWRVSIATSISSNMITTLLIAYKLWTHRKFVIQHFGRRRNSRVQRVLIIVIESGVVYCAFQIATLGFNHREERDLQGPATYFAGQIFFAAYTVISGMYPTIVFALVNNQRSVADIYSLSMSSDSFESNVECDGQQRSGGVGSISFALPPNHNAITNDSLPGLTEDTGLRGSLEKVYRLTGEAVVPARPTIIA